MHCASVFPLLSGPTIYTVYMLYRFAVIACGINCVNKAIESTFLTYNSQFSYSSISLSLALPFLLFLPSLSHFLVLVPHWNVVACLSFPLTPNYSQHVMHQRHMHRARKLGENLISFPFPPSLPLPPLLILESTIFCPYINCFHD